MDRQIALTRGIKRLICWTLKTYLVSANYLLSLMIYIDNLPIVLCSPLDTERFNEIDIFGRSD